MESSWVNRKGRFPEWHPKTPQQMPPELVGDPSNLLISASSSQQTPPLRFPEPGSLLSQGPNDKLHGTGSHRSMRDRKPQEHASICSLQPEIRQVSGLHPPLKQAHEGRDSFSTLLSRTSLTRWGRSKNMTHPAKKSSRCPLQTQATRQNNSGEGTALLRQ